MRGLTRRRTTVDRAVREAAQYMPDNGDLNELISRLSAARGRPLALVHHELAPDGPSGVWIDLPEKDYLVVATDAPPSREAAIICHELGHIVLGHAGPSLTSGVDMLAPDISPHVTARFLNRHSYEDQQERDAEAFGTMLAAEHARRRSRHSTSGLSDRLR